MSRSTKDDNFTESEFTILTEIVKRFPDQHTTAILQDVVGPYQGVLESHGIDSKTDEHYWSCVMRLMLYKGRSWREKLLNAIPPLTKSTAPKAHRRYNSETVNGPGLDRQDVGSRSVVRQQLDHGPHMLEPSHLPRTPRPSTQVMEPPVLTAEHKNALVGRYKVFMRSHALQTMHLCMEIWNEAARTKYHIHREQLAYAIAEDHGTLMQQAFEIWFRAYQNNKQFYDFQQRRADVMMQNKFYRRWEHRIIERKEGQYQARLAAEKRARLHSAITRVKQLGLKRSVDSWREKLELQDFREAEALTLCEKWTLGRAWKHWFFRACDRRTIEFRRTVMGRQAFSYWRSKAKVNAILAQRADGKYESDLLARSLEYWRLNYACQEEAVEEAVNHDAKVSLQICLKHWRLVASLSNRSRRVRVIVERNLKQELISAWWDMLKVKQDTEQYARNARTKRLFLSWLREAKATAFLAHINHKSQRQVIAIWRENLRLVSVQNFCHEGALQSAFRVWRTKYEDLVYRLEDAEDQVVDAKDSRLLDDTLGIWIDRLKRKREMEYKADDIYYHTILHFAFSRMKEELEEREFRWRRALNIEKNHTRRHTLRAWLGALHQKRWQDRQERLTRLMQSQEDNLLRKALQTWQTKAIRLVELSEFGDDMHEARMTSQLRYFFTAWQDRHLDLFEMERVAADRDRRSLARFMYDRLCEAHLRVKGDKETANLWYIRNVCVPAATRALEQWVWAYHRQLEQQDKAELLARHFMRREKERVRVTARKLFRYWLVRAAQARGQEDLSSGSFDLQAETTLVPWDAPSYRVKM